MDGSPIPATILGMGLTLAYGGKAQVEQGQGVYFYLPKVEVVEEARFYRDFFDFGRERLGYPDDAVIRGIFLVESLPAVYIMDELLRELGPVRCRTQRGTLGLQGLGLGVHHVRPQPGLAGPVWRGHQDDRVHDQHLQETGSRMPSARRGAHRR